MLNELRTFVHWIDAILHVDCTKEKCDAVYAAAQDRQAEEQAAQRQSEKAGKETSKFLREAFAAAIPSLISWVTSAPSRPSAGFPGFSGDHRGPAGSEVHVGRRPVVVDREEQGDPDRAHGADGGLGARQAAVIQSMLERIPNAIAALDTRIVELERGASRLDEIALRMSRLETFVGMKVDAPPAQDSPAGAA